MFIYESLHVSVVKFHSHISLKVFRLSIVLSNYLDDSVSRLASTFTLERYGPYAYLLNTSMTE